MPARRRGDEASPPPAARSPRTAELLRRAGKAGAIGGAVTVYLAAVGMIEKFQVRNLVDDVLTLSRLMLALPAFMAAYLAVRPRILRGGVEQARAPAALLAGGIAGGAAGAITAAGIGLWHAFPAETVRSIFVSLSPPLFAILTFGQSPAIAAVVLIATGAALGVVGAATRMLPPAWRRPLFAATAVTLTLALLQRVVPTLLAELGLLTDWLYSPVFLGLTTQGALIAFAGSAAVAHLWRRRGPRLAGKLEGGRAGRPLPARAAVLVIVGAVILVLPQVLGSVLTNTLGRVGIFVLMGLGLNIVVGFAGLLDLGYVAFFAVGAYLLALLTGANLVTALGETAAPALALDLSFYGALPLVVMGAAVIGLMIGAPVLRLRGDYLAIVTLGFGEIARLLATSNALRSYTGGAQGLRDVTDAGLFGLTFRSPQNFYYLVLALTLVALWVSWRLSNSRTGRAWAAMREDEHVAEATGISTVKYKLLAFAMGGAIGSFSGALFVVQVGTVQPDTFTILVSITVLAVVILGGMGSIGGVVVGALALVGIPELLAEFEEFKLLIYGAVVIAMMTLRPEGLLPNVARMRELHEEEVAQDAWLRERPAAATTGPEGREEGGASS